MITCNQCGGENQPQFKFCFHCGAPLPAAQLAQVAAKVQWPDNCPQCSAAVAEGQKFCGSCGFGVEKYVLQQASAPAAAAPAAAPVATATPAPEPRAAVVEEYAGEVEVQDFVEEVLEEVSVIEEAVAPPATSTSASSLRASTSPNLAGVPSSAPASEPSLVFVQPNGQPGDSVPLRAGVNVLGRNQGIEAFDRDPYVAPEHLELHVDGATALVIDSGSPNGVFLRLTEPVRLQHGDELRVGKERLRYVALDEEEPRLRSPKGVHVLGSPRGSAWGRLLRITGAERIGEAYLLQQREHVLARERGDILFPYDHYVSGRHARIFREEGVTWFEDLNSSNGSFLRIRERAPLTHGSLLLIGAQPFRLQLT